MIIGTASDEVERYDAAFSINDLAHGEPVCVFCRLDGKPMFWMYLSPDTDRGPDYLAIMDSDDISTLMTAALRSPMRDQLIPALQGLLDETPPPQ